MNLVCNFNEFAEESKLICRGNQFDLQCQVIIAREECGIGWWSNGGQRTSCVTYQSDVSTQIYPCITMWEIGFG